MLCPGSRSAPLALAVEALAKEGLVKLTTAIDERSAAFCALGHSTSKGIASAVITTSGTAVANLLPAAVEADRSCQPLLFITADRPYRLKESGANQTVNQEDFLKSVCRGFFQGPKDGIHLFELIQIATFVEEIWNTSHSFPGPVHLNLALEEPLHPSSREQDLVLSGWSPPNNQKVIKSDFFAETKTEKSFRDLPELDLRTPGVLVVGPWRGLTKDLIPFLEALREFQGLCGWPVFADPLSGVPSDQPGLIHSWELLLPSGFPLPDSGLQLIRLGPMTASRRLEAWLLKMGGRQIVISEGDSRQLDPLGLSVQWSGGLVTWWDYQKKYLNLLDNKYDKKQSHLFLNWQKIDQLAQKWLDAKLPLCGEITEPSLARWLPRLVPTEIPVMLSSSSPVRDWIAFSGEHSLRRRCFGFRGASGIDGTLSLGMGIAMGLGSTLLVTGDLALLHDINGWLFQNLQKPALVVLLIDNQGGGIFQQLSISSFCESSFEKLFAMPQQVDHLELSAGYLIPGRQVSCLDDLPFALEWAFAREGPVLLRLSTHRINDARLRQDVLSELHEYLNSVQQK